MDLVYFERGALSYSVLLLYEVELKAAVYPVLLSAVFGILFFVLGYLRREKKVQTSFFRSVRPAVSYRKV